MSQVIARGTGTIAAGQTSVLIQHGLSLTPNISDIMLQPQDDLDGRNYWPSNPSSTTFQINISFADLTQHVFTWEILGTVGVVIPSGSVQGTFIGTSDVQAALNATYDTVNQVYGVYGLTLGLASFQAHVNFANNYVNSILGSIINNTDPRYQTAWNVALDIACIRVLVVSMGGSLVGAFDYSLADIRVARAGPYKEAIMATLQGFKDELSRQMVNLTPVAISFDLTAKGDVPTYRGGLASP